MSREDAEAVVSCAWTRNQQRHPRLREALKELGITMSTFRELLREAGRQTRRLPRCCVLTPTGTRR